MKFEELLIEDKFRKCGIDTISISLPKNEPISASLLQNELNFASPCQIDDPLTNLPIKFNPTNNSQDSPIRKKKYPRNTK